MNSASALGRRATHNSSPLPIGNLAPAANEEIGIEFPELMQQALRLGVPKDEYYVGRIRPQTLAPWEPVEVEPTHSHDVADVGIGGA